MADGTVPLTRVDVEEPWIAVSLPETRCVPNIITQIPLIFNLGTLHLLCQGIFIMTLRQHYKKYTQCFSCQPGYHSTDQNQPYCSRTYGLTTTSLPKTSSVRVEIPVTSYSWTKSYVSVLKSKQNSNQSKQDMYISPKNAYMTP